MIGNGHLHAPQRKTATRAPAAAKYRHPENPSLTWSGRAGKLQWFVEALKAGKTAEDLAIGSNEATVELGPWQTFAIAAAKGSFVAHTDRA